MGGVAAEQGTSLTTIAERLPPERQIISTYRTIPRQDGISSNAEMTRYVIETSSADSALLSRKPCGREPSPPPCSLATLTGYRSYPRCRARAAAPTSASCVSWTPAKPFSALR